MNYYRLNLKTNQGEWLMFTEFHWREATQNTWSHPNKDFWKETFSHLHMLILVDKWNRNSKEFKYHL